MNDKILQAKRNHHYVWAHHLARWSNDGKNVWHTTPKRKIILDSVRGLAKQEFFYRSTDLSAEEIYLIERVSSQSPEHLQDIHQSFLRDFLNIQHLARIYAESGMRADEIDRVLHALRCNMLEDIHADYEHRARPLIQSLIDGDISFLSDKEKFIDLHNFIGHQISRTKSFRDTLSLAFLRSSQSLQDENQSPREKFDCWWFLGFMLGLNIGWSLYSSRKFDQHCLLVNETNIDFITSDQPVINVHPYLCEEKTTPPADDACDFYYPISPKVAYMVNKSNSFRSGITQISDDTAHDLNTKIAKSAVTHIIGRTRESVAQYSGYIGHKYRLFNSKYTDKTNNT